MSIIKVQQQDKNGNIIYQETDSSLVKVGDNTLDSKITDIESRLNETFQSASNGKLAIANAITGKGITASDNDTFSELSNKINQIPTGINTSDGNITASDVLTGKVGYAKDTRITGTMVNQGAKSSTLNCGGSYTIPAGYHDGTGKVTANSLSSQTSANATAAQILSGYTAWVNGSKLTGTATIESLGGRKYSEGSNIQGGTSSYDVNCGFYPSILIIDGTYSENFGGGSFFYVSSSVYYDSAKVSVTKNSQGFSLYPAADDSKFIFSYVAIG